MSEPPKATWHDVLAKTEWVALVTWDGQQPHMVANWGDYIRSLGEAGSDTLVMPAGRYHQTEANLRRDSRIEVLLASRQCAGTHGPGQGFLLRGEAEVQLNGPWAQRAKAHYPWARGALVIHVRQAQAQL